ncbi:hypothetical protein E4T47_04577 [Aureobasidium subglaciale]|nr:hypothetical protein E4T47_04577 [Aureobasidium subglaciale]
MTGPKTFARMDPSPAKCLQPNEASRTSLLDLPPELRLMIFSIVFESAATFSGRIFMSVISNEVIFIHISAMGRVLPRRRPAEYEYRGQMLRYPMPDYLPSFCNSPVTWLFEHLGSIRISSAYIKRIVEYVVVFRPQFKATASISDRFELSEDIKHAILKLADAKLVKWRAQAERRGLSRGLKLSYSWIEDFMRDVEEPLTLLRISDIQQRRE